MDVENRYASKGIAGSGLGLGIAGTALGLLSNGGLGGILGGGWNNGCCSENNLINRYEAGQAARIAELETEVKLRDANFYTLGEMGKLREYVDNKFAGVESQICQQNVYNAINTTTTNCMANQIAQLMSLTKTIVPASNICPTPMPEFNSWTAPTTTTAGA